MIKIARFISKGFKRLTFVAFAYLFLNSCSSQSSAINNGFLPKYTVEKIDSFRVKKYCKSDVVRNYITLGNKFIYYSKDSNCIVLSDMVTSDVEGVKFLPNFQQYEPGWKPFSVNFGKLDDSTIVVGFANRWPYTEDRILLLNVNSGKKSHPFKIDHPDLVSKYDTSIKSFNDAQVRTVTWFLVSDYEIPVYGADTTIFIPTYTGDILYKPGRNAKFRPNKNCVFPLSTRFNKNNHKIEIYLSQVNPVFKDSVNTKDDFITMCNSYVTFINKNGFVMSFKGSNNLVEYDFNTQTSNVRQLDFPKFQSNTWELGFDNTSLKDILIYYSVISSVDFPYILKYVEHPKLNTEDKNIREFRCFVYDKKFNLNGVLGLNLKYFNIIGTYKDNLIAFNKTSSSNDENWMYFDIYQLRKTNFNVAEDSVFNFELKSKLQNLYTVDDYLKSFDSIQNRPDSIPILICDNYCPTCTHKIGQFIQTIQAVNIKYHPFILYAKDSFALKEFFETYNIDLDENILVDSMNNFEKLSYNNGIGIFLKQSKYKYIFKSVKTEELESLLKYICPKVKIVNGFCIPIKN